MNEGQPSTLERIKHAVKTGQEVTFYYDVGINVTGVPIEVIEGEMSINFLLGEKRIWKKTQDDSPLDDQGNTVNIDSICAHSGVKGIA